MSNNTRMSLVVALGALMVYLVLAAIMAVSGFDTHETFERNWRWWHPGLALFVSCAWAAICLCSYEAPQVPDGLTADEWDVVKELRKR